MVRGGGQLLSWLRAVGGQCDKLRSSSNAGRGVTSDLQVLTRAWGAPVFDGAAGSRGICEEQQIALRRSWGNSARFCTVAESDDVSTPPLAVVKEKSYYVPARHPGAPDPKPRNDRFFRAGNNSTVAHMVRLLEAAPTNADVEKILDDRIAELTETKRWPWVPLLDALQRGPKPYLALEVFNWKKDKFDGGDPKEYAKMISSAGKLRQLDLATTLFKQMESRGVKRTAITCNALISAYSKNNQADQAIALFKEMQETGDCKPTLVTYNTLIAMYSKLNYQDMERYFEACKEAGFFPDRLTYNSLIWGYMRAGMFDKMEEVYEQLMKAGCKPDPITFSALIIGFSKASALEKMESAFSHMQEEGFAINDMIGEIMVELYAAERHFEKMERIMKIITNTPGTSCTSRIYGLAIEAYAETRRIEEMERTIDVMLASRRLFTSSKTLESVIEAYGEKSNFEGLERTVTRVKSLGWTYQLTTFHTLLHEYGKGRMFDKMEDVFDEMKRAEDAQPTAETYQILADSYDSAGEGEMLMRTIERMRAAGFNTQLVTEKEVDRAWTDDEIFGGKRR